MIKEWNNEQKCQRIRDKRLDTKSETEKKKINKILFQRRLN